MKHVIYQVLPRLWGNGLFSDWDKRSFDYLKSLGVDCLWLTGVPRHASGKPFVKGNPGSPYAIEDWFDVNDYLSGAGRDGMSEFRSLVSRAHDSGLKIITDYIPNHLARDYSGDIPVKDYCDFDWTDTRKVDWDNDATVGKMADVLRFWAESGVDGFRCDMVELVPAEKLGEVIRSVRKDYPELLFIAEVYERSNYGRYIGEGFDLLYDKSGTYDILRRICAGNGSAEELSWNWQFLGPMQGNMLNFLENHDEQRLCSREFAVSFERTRAMLAFSMLFNTASFMLYFGEELGENASESDNGRTSIFDYTTVSSERKINKYIKSGKLSSEESVILETYRTLGTIARRKCFSEGKVWDLGYCNSFDKRKIFAFVRYDSSECWLCVCNFGDEGPVEMLVGLPSELLENCPENTASSVEVKLEKFGYYIRKIG